YEEAQAIIDAALKDADDYGLLFAKPHLLWNKACVELGLRRFSRADAHLRTVEDAARKTDHAYLDLNARALRARLPLTQHRAKEAVEVTSLAFDEIPTRAMYGEYLATRALSLAVTRDSVGAYQLAQEARDLTNVVEVRALAATAEAIAALE